MSAPTGDPRIVAELNELLGRELGRNEYGKPYFSWRWSEDLFWPAAATGRTLLNETKVLTPIIGAPADTHDFEEAYDAANDTFDSDWGGKSDRCVHCGNPESDLAHNVYSIMQRPEPEYQSDRQYRRRDTWVICKWLTPWELILGPGRGATSIMHGDQRGTDKAPPVEAVIAAWNRQFPGAAFPAKGWRVPTDAYLPHGPDDENWAGNPFGHTTPHRQDTEHFIKNVKYQTSRPFAEVEQSFIASDIEKERRIDVAFMDDCRDAFPAFLNPKQGARGSFVSMPWTKHDRAR